MMYEKKKKHALDEALHEVPLTNAWKAAGGNKC